MITDHSVIALCITAIVIAAPSAWRGRKLAAKIMSFEGVINATQDDARQTKAIAVSLDKQLNQVPDETPTIREHLENIDGKLIGVDTRLVTIESQIGIKR